MAFGLGLAAVLIAANLPTFDGRGQGGSAVVSLGDSAISDTSLIPTSDVGIKAKAVYIFDVKANREIFSLNAEAQLPLASLTKLMTALVAEKNVPFYVLIPISKEVISQEGNEGFIVDERWPVSDLIDIMLISSSNDAAYALAEGLVVGSPTSPISQFVELMNKKAGELGLTQTYFLNPTGLDISKTQAGAYGSAKDIASLFLYILKEKASLFEVTRFLTLKIDGREFKNTNKIVNEIPRVIFGKTGTSDLAGGNLAVVVDRGFENYVIMVVLGSTEEGRFEDVRTIYKFLISDF